MICFNRQFLTAIGMTSDEMAAIESTLDGGGLATSSLFSFGGGGNRGRDTRALEYEPVPRRLVLVAMSDSYDAGRSRAVEVQELCVNNVTGLQHRMPTSDEAVLIASVLETCTHPCAAAIRARILTF